MFADKNAKAEADICIKAFDIGLQESFKAEKRRLRQPLREILGKGLAISYQP